MEAAAAARLEQSLRDMREDGTVKAIMQRHLSSERALAMQVR
jgi:polar amino acid transport system substrate-binding protein